jgi:segregation and condensation protein B
MERTLRLIATSPVDALARTVEALLIVASQPLGVDELAEATNEDAERIQTALALLAERYREGRSGIVLERVAGGWAFRASRDAAEACERLFERPVRRGLSAAALETLAIVAYRQPVTKAAIERIRGVDSDYTVRALLHRRLVVEQGRSEAPGRPILYGTGFEFLERFGLASLEELPFLDLDIAARLVDGDGGDEASDGVEAVGEGAPPAGRGSGPKPAATADDA